MSRETKSCIQAVMAVGIMGVIICSWLCRYAQISVTHAMLVYDSGGKIIIVFKIAMTNEVIPVWYIVSQTGGRRYHAANYETHQGVNYALIYRTRKVYQGRAVQRCEDKNKFDQVIGGPVAHLVSLQWFSEQ